MKKTILILNLIVFLFILAGCRQSVAHNKTFYAMGTFINVTLYNTAEEHLDEIEAIYREYSNLSDMQYECNGINNVCTINNNRSALVDDKLLALLKYAIDVEKQMDGYFNILMGELTSLWKDRLGFSEHVDTPAVPSLEEINRCLATISNSSLTIEGNVISIIGDAMLDLGAVAKGYATQMVYLYLKENNITSYLIDAGNSNILLGNKNFDEKFTIGLKKSDNTGYYKTLKIRNKAIVTSSIDQQNVVIDDVLYTHIINPKTGFNENYYDIVTLIGEDSAKLDILSTALFNMKLEEIQALLANMDVKAILVKNNQIVYSSLGDDFDA